MIIDGKGNHVPDLTVDPPETDGYEGDLEDYRQDVIGAIETLAAIEVDLMFHYEDLLDVHKGELEQTVLAPLFRKHQTLHDCYCTKRNEWENMTYPMLAEYKGYGYTPNDAIDDARTKAKKEEE